jgi:hypothetical protein
MGGRELVDTGDELPGHRSDQRSRGDREATVTRQRADHLAGALKLRHKHVQVHAVDRLDLQPHVAGQDITSRAR